MKTVGVIGGIGPESTIEYYRQPIAAYRALKPDGSYRRMSPAKWLDGSATLTVTRKVQMELFSWPA
jgi:aspartate/glutamate racemase